jgi:hypothetical protein
LTNKRGLQQKLVSEIEWKGKQNEVLVVEITKIKDEILEQRNKKKVRVVGM